MHWSAPVMTVGLDDAVVEYDLGAGLLGCPVVGCGGVLGPWGWARKRPVSEITNQFAGLIVRIGAGGFGLSVA